MSYSGVICILNVSLYTRGAMEKRDDIAPFSRKGTVKINFTGEIIVSYLQWERF